MGTIAKQLKRAVFNRFHCGSYLVSYHLQLRELLPVEFHAL